MGLFSLPTQISRFNSGKMDLQYCILLNFSYNDEVTIHRGPNSKHQFYWHSCIVTLGALLTPQYPRILVLNLQHFYHFSSLANFCRVPPIIQHVDPASGILEETNLLFSALNEDASHTPEYYRY